jgi:hypothetical protein
MPFVETLPGKPNVDSPTAATWKTAVVASLLGYPQSLVVGHKPSLAGLVTGCLAAHKKMICVHDLLTDAFSRMLSLIQVVLAVFTRLEPAAVACRMEALHSASS